MGCTYQNCSFSRGKNADAVPIKTVVSATGKARRESSKTVAFEQLPVYVPTHEGRQKHGRARMSAAVPRTLPPCLGSLPALPTAQATRAQCSLTGWGFGFVSVSYRQKGLYA